MLNVEKFIERLTSEGIGEISSFEIALLIRELSYGYHTKFDEYLDDWVSGKAELEKANKAKVAPPVQPIKKNPKKFDDIFLDE